MHEHILNRWAMRSIYNVYSKCLDWWRAPRFTVFFFLTTYICALISSLPRVRQGLGSPRFCSTLLYIPESDDLCTYGNQSAAVVWVAYGYAENAEYRNDIIRMSSWRTSYGFANPSSSDILYIHYSGKLISRTLSIPIAEAASRASRTPLIIK